MAGIGFALRKLSSSGTLSASASALAVSAIISVGPWIFTVIAVATLNMMTVERVGLNALFDFRVILIYNFAITLVGAGPVAMIATRLLADRLYMRNAEPAPGVALSAIALVFLLQTPVAIGLYVFYADIPLAMRVTAILNFYVVSALWVAAVFLSALKDYGAITMAFAAGLIIAFGGAMVLAPWGAPGLMLGFTIGLAVTLFALLARTFAEYPYTTRGWRLLFSYLRQYPDVALSGLIYNGAIWADKFVMWSAPEAVWPPSGLVTYPAYDGAMFFAQLTLIPAFALFVLSVETSFFSVYRRFYRTIENHGTWSQISSAHSVIMSTLASNARRLILLQVCIVLFTLILTPGLATLFGIHGQQIGMFRLGVLGSLFHALFLFTAILLAYFDLRREVLIVQAVFLVTNALFTWMSLQMGFLWYGYGYFLACAVSFALAATIAIAYIRDLPYLTFIVNNPALKGVQMPRR